MDIAILLILMAVWGSQLMGYMDKSVLSSYCVPVLALCIAAPSPSGPEAQNERASSRGAQRLINMLANATKILLLCILIATAIISLGSKIGFPDYTNPYPPPGAPPEYNEARPKPAEPHAPPTFDTAPTWLDKPNDFTTLRPYSLYFGLSISCWSAVTATSLSSKPVATESLHIYSWNPDWPASKPKMQTYTPTPCDAFGTHPISTGSRFGTLSRGPLAFSSQDFGANAEARSPLISSKPTGVALWFLTAPNDANRMAKEDFLLLHEFDILMANGAYPRYQQSVSEAGFSLNTKPTALNYGICPEPTTPPVFNIVKLLGTPEPSDRLQTPLNHMKDTLKVIRVLNKDLPDAAYTSGTPQVSLLARIIALQTLSVVTASLCITALVGHHRRGKKH
ncbi:hypothetical protein FGG08_004254 [Glutinoglossum americanum]|uniref:Uncharacterized protein n=1 Tax=Glutinoglossum americanum TaxID=1670608 RepID=A0A9P8I5N2_9PEZI|nr:hypothetical protein FGG08_004254 [Glutinoglossum americanum]